ncbi:hypothetical protein A3B02_02445 [Candidatus Roizmanbacteria bacterium RIFCSPLOWO2_01_FULL_42_14]|uniref:Uncharacterized protein n=2 Tax=Candidatus Roizmaniibacteriota TaxID=1752723 RepID=A0A1F7JWD9_9BACT|nr:MAG: hypothetical protein A3B02_02445 [Candidatus Roizmanbacteria bacterium RIFCSPLOWO2_01_FULL_42_14]OGK59884.1 MAG: hypothetical protein A3I56_03400 [Candidatus Roizmanbacteria bacterium RIFCSPLOWO2_02_FULL_43_10]
MAKKIVTKKEHTILLLLYIFRFLNSKQIQEFLIHKDHRRINSWLKDLEEKEYIVREYTPIYGVLTKPAVCYLTTKGRKHIKESYNYYFPPYLKRISRDHKVSKAFKTRCQIIADWYITRIPPTKAGISIVDTLIKHCITAIEEKMPLNTVQFFTPSYFPTFKLLKHIKPDAYIRKKAREGIAPGFLFVVDPYVSRLVIRYTIKRIFTTLNEEYWEDDVIAFHMYFLCPNNQVIIYLRRMLPTQLEQEYASGTPLHFHLATRNQLYNYKQGKIETIKWITISSEDEDDE